MQILKNFFVELLQSRKNDTTFTLLLVFLSQLIIFKFITLYLDQTTFIINEFHENYKYLLNNTKYDFTLFIIFSAIVGLRKNNNNYLRFSLKIFDIKSIFYIIIIFIAVYFSLPDNKSYFHFEPFKNSFYLVILCFSFLFLTCLDKHKIPILLFFIIMVLNMSVYNTDIITSLSHDFIFYIFLTYVLIYCCILIIKKLKKNNKYIKYFFIFNTLFFTFILLFLIISPLINGNIPTKYNYGGYLYLKDYPLMLIYLFISVFIINKYRYNTIIIFSFILFLSFFTYDILLYIGIYKDYCFYGLILLLKFLPLIFISRYFGVYCKILKDKYSVESTYIITVAISFCTSSYFTISFIILLIIIGISKGKIINKKYSKENLKDSLIIILLFLLIKLY